MTQRHSSGVEITLTKKEQAEFYKELIPGERVQLLEYGDGSHTATVVEQSENRGLTWVKDATCALTSPAIATAKLRRIK